MISKNFKHIQKAINFSIKVSGGMTIQFFKLYRESLAKFEQVSQKVPTLGRCSIYLLKEGRKTKTTVFMKS